MGREEVRTRALAEIPRWYVPWMHLAGTTGFGATGILVAVALIHDVRPLEWLTVPATFLFANAFEWWVHKNVLHKRRPPFGELFDRHTPVHHAVYTEEAMQIESQREWRLVLIPAVGVLGAIVCAAPVAAIAAYFLSANVGYLVMAVASAYMLSYELLHLAYHLPESHFISRIGIVRTLKKQHATHHRADRMQKVNFNVTIPLFDWVLGTLDKGDAASSAPSPSPSRVSTRPSTPPP